MATLWAKTVSFESINLGDHLPIVIKWETVESIQRFNARVAPDAQEDAEEYAEAEPALHPSALLSYVKELLGRSFPAESITAPASHLDLKLTAPVMAEDTISLSGKVVSKRADDTGGLVECEIVIENHRREAVGRALAVVALVNA